METEIINRELKRAGEYIREAENQIDATAHPRSLKIQARQMADSLVKDFCLFENEIETLFKEWSGGFYTDEVLRNFMDYAMSNNEGKIKILNSPEERAEREAYIKSVDPRAGMTPEELAEHDRLFEIEHRSLIEGVLVSAVKKPALHYELAGDCKLDADQPALIEGVLDRGTMSVLYAESGQAKTTLATGMAWAIATNTPCFGRDVQQGAAVYVQSESAISSRKRILALRKKYGKEDAPFILIPCPVDLSGRGADVQPLLTLIQEAVHEINQNVVFIVIDTLSRVLSGGNENTAEDMGAFIGNVDRIRHATQAHVMVIHHSGKDKSKGARGSSALRAATDTEIEIEKVSGTGPATVRKLRISKQRDSKEGQELGFRLETVLLGYDSKGREISSVVIQPCDLQATGQFTPVAYKAGSPEANAFIALKAAGGVEKGVSGPDWLERYRFFHPGAQTGAKKTLYRAKATLIKDGIVVDEKGLFRLNESKTTEEGSYSSE